MPPDSLRSWHVSHSFIEECPKTLEVVGIFTSQEKLNRSPIGEAIEDAECRIERDP
jgi:hypothetical protein